MGNLANFWTALPKYKDPNFLCFVASPQCFTIVHYITIWGLLHKTFTTEKLVILTGVFFLW